MRQARAIITMSTLVLLGAVVSAQEETRATRAELPELSPGKDWREVEVKIPNSMQARAWSDPAAGCHLALLALPIQDAAARDQIATSLSGVLAKSDYLLTEVDDGQAQTRFTLEGFGVNGFVTLDVPQGKERTATMLACYWNHRESAHCRAECEAANQAQGQP